jgi:pimeloyl-ACP methyl ester carboxylesterase
MKVRRFFFLLLIFVSAPVYADVMLLVHGFLGHAFSWEKSGINIELQRLGWQRAGTFEGGPYGPQLLVATYNGADNLVYTATLPFEAPVMVQADVLKTIFDIIQQRHPDQQIILVGHSAGGVVARMLLVRYQPENIKGLITIASPHVGTAKADQALDITANHGPFNIVKNVVGGDNYDALKHSRGLMHDLMHPAPGNMLYWLNSQPHPDIHYASVIRLDKDREGGDKYVPGFSQNMNNVPALFGKSSVYITPASHSLLPQDAHTIVSIIQHW